MSNGTGWPASDRAPFGGGRFVCGYAVRPQPGCNLLPLCCLSLFFFDTSVQKKKENRGVTNYFCSLSGIPENCVNSVAGCITEY